MKNEIKSIPDRGRIKGPEAARALYVYELEKDEKKRNKVLSKDAIPDLYIF